MERKQPHKLNIFSVTAAPRGKHNRKSCETPNRIRHPSAVILTSSSVNSILLFRIFVNIPKEATAIQHGFKQEKTGQLDIKRYNFLIYGFNNIRIKH